MDQIGPSDYCLWCLRGDHEDCSMVTTICVCDHSPATVKKLAGLLEKIQSQYPWVRFTTE